MSFDHWWVGVFVDDATYELIKPDFAAAAKRAVISRQAHQAFAVWRHRPSDFEQGAAITEASAARVSAFISAFNLPGFDGLAERVLTQSGKFSGIAAEQHLFRMLITARNTPVSIVWHALGFERAHLLPGQLGNLLLHAREIDEASEKTQRAYQETSMRDLLEVARRYCSRDVYDDTLREALSFLPEGLKRAKERRRGFLALARPQI